jgi:hypothetical protein
MKRLLSTVVVIASLTAVAISAGGQPKPPKKIVATRITRPAHTLAVGTPVKASSLGQRVFVTATRGFSLAATGDAQYPAQTTNGGASWKTFGPALHLNAAQAPLAVTEVGAANARAVYYYGSGQAVDVTSNGGRTWWRAFAPELSLAVVPGVSGRLVWIVQDGTGSSGERALTWVYESTDGGRVWHYTDAVGGGF